jgi:hypothetical protein
MTTPLLQVDPPDVLVSALKPADSGKGLIVRLFNEFAPGRRRGGRPGTSQTRSHNGAGELKLGVELGAALAGEGQSVRTRRGCPLLEPEAVMGRLRWGNQPGPVPGVWALGVGNRPTAGVELATPQLVTQCSACHVR